MRNMSGFFPTPSKSFAVFCPKQWANNMHLFWTSDTTAIDKACCRDTLYQTLVYSYKVYRYRWNVLNACACSIGNSTVTHTLDLEHPVTENWSLSLSTNMNTASLSTTCITLMNLYPLYSFRKVACASLDLWEHGASAFGCTGNERSSAFYPASPFPLT
jgi:hypothetical protein